MSPREVEAVTFDFWDTLFEAGRGRLLAKRAEAIAGLLFDAGRPTSVDHLELLFEEIARTFDQSWKANEQYRFDDALDWLLTGLDVTEAGLADAVRQAWLRSYDEADVRPRPDAVSAVRRLSDAGLGLAIVCDVSLVPSTVLRRFLDRAGIADAFTVFSWSDELGVYKPDPAMFRHALDGLGVAEPARAFHVGDKRRTDVAGAQAMGMTAVRYTGVVDDPGENGDPEGDHVIADHTELLPILGIH